MTIEKLPSGSYRIKQMYKGKRYSITVDHKPTQKEATILMAERMQDIVSGKTAALSKCIDNYIDSKHNVLSPSTIKGYVAVTRNSPQWFLDMNVYDITQYDIQRAVNEYSTNHSPKSVRNFHALMISAIKMFRPNISFNTTLPQKEAKETTVPNHDDIMRLLDAMRNHDYYPCVVLGCLGLRRSEIQALEPSDFDDDRVLINKAKVLNEYNKPVVKATKTTASTRYVYVPSNIIQIIKDRGYVYRGNHNTLINVMHRYQDQIGMPRCRFHDLRHFYVSYAHSIGMSDAAIIKAVGHSTDTIMKNVYRHSMNDKEEQERVARSIFNNDSSFF